MAYADGGAKVALRTYKDVQNEAKAAGITLTQEAAASLVVAGALFAGASAMESMRKTLDDIADNGLRVKQNG